MSSRAGVAAAAVIILALGTNGAAAAGGKKSFKADLDGFQEVPPVSTSGEGDFRAKLHGNGDLDYELSYDNLVGSAVRFAHIHFGRTGLNGGVIVFLCANLNPPPGVPPCPPLAGGTVNGVITAADVIGPAAQGIAAEDFAALEAALRNEATYVNVHTDGFPGGEIRGNLD